ncbi:MULTISPECIES: hypothetical protein [Natrialbaceae]|uniref:hypothetical protein n=1 Tax=Natrialbaceae TaxID=1644061 RepID=UPI00207C2DBD|nr:hypothetical protein [Natronococcus sp. CG52]
MFTDDEIGKHVETAGGETIGVVVSVDGATAYVERDPSALDAINAVFGRETDEEGASPIDEEDVEAVTDDAVRLERNRSSRDGDAEGSTDPDTEHAEETGDEAGRSGEAMEPSTEEMDEAGAERHPETEDTPPEGDRTVTKDRGSKENR